jgi:hypothetical protein
MKLSFRGRLLVIAAASASLLAVPLAMPASAATGAQCKKLSEKTVGSKITFSVSQCTPLTATGGSGSGPVSGTKPGQTKGSVNVTVTWAKFKGKATGTTKANVNFAPTSPGKCPLLTTRLKITGKVTGGSGTALKYIKKGQAVSGSVCLNAKTGGVSLEPGTNVKF